MDRRTLERIARRIVIAQRPPDALTSLAGDADKSVRWGVAKNPSTPPDVLASLAGDADKSVRREVAENPNYRKS